MSQPPADQESTTERWDRLYTALSSEPRRMILYSLMNEPAERRLPLPDAAESSESSIEQETLSLQLRHRHLPKLAESGYIRWQSDPFCVQRGPYFDEPAAILDSVLERSEGLPQSLRADCRVLQD